MGARRVPGLRSSRVGGRAEGDREGRGLLNGLRVASRGGLSCVAVAMTNRTPNRHSGSAPRYAQNPQAS